jgi:hypothetical protein
MEGEKKREPSENKLMELTTVRKTQTRIKQALQLPEDISQLSPLVIDTYRRCFASKKMSHRIIAMKEASKYIYAQKRDHSGTLDLEINVKFDDLQ